MITLAIERPLFPATPTSTLEPYVELSNDKLSVYRIDILKAGSATFNAGRRPAFCVCA